MGEHSETDRAGIVSQRKLVRSPMLLLAMALTAMLAAAGCGDSEQAVINSSPIRLSDALAYRDGPPTITIISPLADATVVSPLMIEVEASNLTLSPAGETRDGQGHLHVLIDQDCQDVGLLIPNGAKEVHLGDGRAAVELELSPGQHEICVQVGDGFHTAVDIVARVAFTVGNWEEPTPADESTGSTSAE
ncbi:MAG: DUF4399 domain-containing protein [Acidimicrobiales bacterium]